MSKKKKPTTPATGGGIFGPVVTSPPPLSPAPVKIPTKQAFNRAYHLSKPADVQRMREIGNPALRKARAEQIMNQYVIDLEVDVDGSDAFDTHTKRPENGWAWYPSMSQPPVQPPTALPVPGGSIKSSTDLHDYLPLTPPRSFTIANFFATVSWLNEQGIYTANPDRHMCLPGGLSASEAMVEKLTTIMEQTFVFDGAQGHFGIAIAGTGKIVDAEEISLLIPNVDAVRAYIAGA